MRSDAPSVIRAVPVPGYYRVGSTPAGLRSDGLHACWAAIGCVHAMAQEPVVYPEEPLSAARLTGLPTHPAIHPSTGFLLLFVALRGSSLSAPFFLSVNSPSPAPSHSPRISLNGNEMNGDRAVNSAAGRPTSPAHRLRSSDALRAAPTALSGTAASCTATPLYRSFPAYSYCFIYYIFLFMGYEGICASWSCCGRVICSSYY